VQAPEIQTAMSGSEGRFTLHVTHDGAYSVIAGTRPFEQIPVTVEQGHGDREVVLTTGAADLLREHSFSLVTDERGDLVVDRADAEADLRAGDVIDGLLVAGIDVGSVLPEQEDLIIDAVLEHYGGPGVTLRVDRDGTLVEVPLD
jgi:hypothetical protein